MPVMSCILRLGQNRIWSCAAATIIAMALWSSTGRAADKDPRFERPSGAILLPPEFAWTAETGDTRIEGVLREALYLDDNGHFTEAIEKYEELLKFEALGAAKAPTYNSIAGCYGKLGKFADEVSWARKAVAELPQFALGYINLGSGYLGLGLPEEAAQAYQKFVDLRPSDPRGYYSLGVIADQRQRWDQAEQLYSKSVDLDPRFVEGRFNLAAARANQGKYELAIRDLQQVLGLDPHADNAREMLEELQRRR